MEPDRGSGEVYEAGDVDGSAVVSRGGAPAMLEPVGASLDLVAVLVGGGIVWISHLPAWES